MDFMSYSCSWLGINYCYYYNSDSASPNARIGFYEQWTDNYN